MEGTIMVHYELGGLNAAGGLHWRPVETTKIGTTTTVEDPDGWVIVTVRTEPEDMPESKIVTQRVTSPDKTQITLTKYWYDENGHRKKSVTLYFSDEADVYEPDEQMAGTEYQYDSYGRLVHMIDLDGVKHVTVYHSEAPGGFDWTELVAERYSEKNGVRINHRKTHYYSYTAPGYQRLKPSYEEELQNGVMVRTKTYTYLAPGNTGANTHNAGKLERIDYPQINTPGNTSEVYTYDCCGVKTFKNRLGGITAYGYHEISKKLVATTNANNGVELRDYDPATGRLESITDPTGVKQTFRYDAQGRRDKVTYENGPMDGLFSETGYRLDGRVEWTLDPFGTETSYEYQLETGRHVKTFRDNLLVPLLAPRMALLTPNPKSWWKP